MASNHQICIRFFFAELYLCSKCSSKFISYKKLNDHFKIDHYGQEFMLFCPFSTCVRQRFGVRKSFERHLKSHSKKDKIDSFHINSHESVTLPNITLENMNSKLNDENISAFIGSSPIEFNQNSKLSQLLNTMSDNLFRIALNIYSHPSLPMNAAKEILNDVLDIVVKPFSEIIVEIQPNLQQTLIKFQKKLSEISTEYKFLNVLNEKGFYHKPTTTILKEYYSEVVTKGKTSIGIVQEKCVIMNIESQLKTFLELPGILDLILEYSEEQSNTPTIDSYISGEQWKNKLSNSNSIVLAMDLYSDDFEVNNPLGSNTGTNCLTGFYYSMPNLPPHISTRLNNIFVALIVESKVLSNSDNLDSCLAKIEELINKISTFGINVKIKGENIPVYLKLGLWKGDNLGLNKCLGFSPSFNSNYYCRFCKIHRKDAQHKCDLIGVELRNFENYQTDLNKPFNQSGISFPTKLNGITDFHATNNPFADKMHDFEEGVAVYDLQLILHHFIIKKKYFTLQRLNFIKKYFNYGENEVGNRSVPLKYVTKLLRGKRVKEVRIKMSASEVKCFLKFLPIMIRHLVPERDPVWKFLIKLTTLSELLDLSSYSESNLKHLKQVITDHHKTYRRLFPRCTLKPKFHFLLHYPQLIRSMGPPSKNNCYMFEMKHKVLKLVAKVVNSRRFLPITVAKKIALQDAKKTFEMMRNINSEFTECVLVNQHKEMNRMANDHKHLLDICNINSSTVTYYSKIKYRNHLYRINSIISQNKSTFYKITAIINCSGKFYVALRKLKSIIDKKTLFYKIVGSMTRSFINFTEIKSFPMNVHNVQGIRYIKSKLF